MSELNSRLGGDQMPELPIMAYKDEIIDAVLRHPVVIVEGPTGSGKSTSIPMFLNECEELTKRGIIGITEPRRIAARSVSEYVARTLGCELGKKVAYQVRFDNITSVETQIKFMTDGILLREIQSDSDLSQYSVIIVDEAHERGINIDLILGLLKKLLKTRQDLRVVVTSATIDTNKFSEYFDDAPVIRVPGRCHPVEVIYRPLEDSCGEYAHSREAAYLVREIHATEGPGDILVFMSGMDDILVCARELERMNLSGLQVLIAHRDMSSLDEDRIFMVFPRARKVIIGTNIIETGITVSGVKYGIDSGHIKLTGFEPTNGLCSLKRSRHSKAGCDQRTGRTGRTEPGICYRLFDAKDYDSRPSYTRPEILRTELAGLVLMMKSIGIHDIEGFDFLDNPGLEVIRAAHETLVKLGAITSNNGLTETGLLMAKLPDEPRSTRMIVEAIERGCVDQILTVVAFRSLQSVFTRPWGKEREADLAKTSLQSPGSDYLTWLNVYNAYLAHHKSRTWAESHFLKSKVLVEVDNIKSQLVAILDEAEIEISSSTDRVEIAKCVTAGLVENVCRRQNAASRKYMSGNMWLQIFPGSALKKTCPQWFVCNMIRDNGKEIYGMDCQSVRPEWLYEVAPHLFNDVIIPRSLRYSKESSTYLAKARPVFDGSLDIGNIKSLAFPPDHPGYQEVRDLYEATHGRQGRNKGRKNREKSRAKKRRY